MVPISSLGGNPWMRLMDLIEQYNFMEKIPISREGLTGKVELFFGWISKSSLPLEGLWLKEFLKQASYTR
jgi:hypothetical protein